MPISATISSDTVIVEPGTTAPLTIDVENQGIEDDRIEVGIEGIDGEWVAIPVPIIELRPGERQNIKVFFNPPRQTESTAGNFPFVARVRSLKDGEKRTAQGVLTVKPYHHISVDLNPKKGFVTATKRQNVFTATLLNLGNQEHTLKLFADDPEETCTYEFDEEEVTLSPGQQKDVDFLVNPKRTTPFGSSRLVGFAVTTRSTDVPGVVATTQAQLEIRPFLTPASAIVLAIVFLLGMVLWYTQPKPPGVTLSLVSAKRTYVGSKVTVRWTAENATAVKLVAGGEIVGENLAPEGSQEVDATLVGTLKIQAVAFRDKRQSEAATVTVEVDEPPVIPEPKIVEMAPSKTTVNKGEKFTLNYKFNNAVVRAKLAPLNIELDLNVNSLLIEPTTLGVNEYTLVVENVAKKIVKQTFKVTMVEPCLAKIIKFDVQPRLVDAIDGKVTMTWQVDTATRVEFTYTGAKTFTLDPSGSTEIPILAKTTFELTAYDQNGKSVSQAVTVDVTKPKVDPDDGTVPPNDPPPPTDGGGSGGSAGKTTGTR